MDNFRLAEVGSEYIAEGLEQTSNGKDIAMQSTVQALKERIVKLEERLNLLLSLKQQNLDLSKFMFDIKPL